MICQLRSEFKFLRFDFFFQFYSIYSFYCFSFYRFVIESELQFSDDKLESGPIAKFSGVPASSLLTQNLQVLQRVFLSKTQKPFKCFFYIAETHFNLCEFFFAFF